MGDSIFENEIAASKQHLDHAVVITWEEGIAVIRETYKQAHIVSGTIPGYWDIHGRVHLPANSPCHLEENKKKETRQN